MVTMLGDTMYLENIREYVKDHKNIVTYKWLSRKMEVPVNAAKQMLYAYVEQNPSVESTYLISGITEVEEQKVHEVHLVKGSELESLKQQFIEVLGVHVYSVHEVQMKDSESLYVADYDMCTKHLDEYSRWSPIDCPNTLSVPPTSKVISKSDSNYRFPQVSKETESKVFPKKSTVNTKTESTNRKVPPKGKGKKPFFKPSSDIKEKEVSSVKQEPVALIDSDIKIPVYKDEKEPIISVCKEEEDSKATLKTLSLERSPTQMPDQPIPEGKHAMLGFLSDSDIDDGESDEEPKSKPVAKRQIKEEKHSQADSPMSKTGKRVAKKKRRVQEISSDEEEAVLSVGNLMERNGKRNRKRTKKLVSRIHINEDGDMVTEKVWESESTDATDEESEKLPGKSPAKESVSTPRKTSPIKQEKKKQASLFKFMKK